MARQAVGICGDMVTTVVEEHVLEHPWTVVSEALWRKYPHPRCPQVSDVDVLARALSSDGHVLRTRRLFSGAIPLPRVVLSALGAAAGGERDADDAGMFYAVEDSLVDARHAEAHQWLQSESLKEYVEIREHCRYTPHPTNSKWTCFRHEWTCEWRSPRAVARAIERLAAQRFRSTAVNGRKALLHACQLVEADTRSPSP